MSSASRVPRSLEGFMFGRSLVWMWDLINAESLEARIWLSGWGEVAW